MVFRNSLRAWIVGGVAGLVLVLGAVTLVLHSRSAPNTPVAAAIGGSVHHVGNGVQQPATGSSGAPGVVVIPGHGHVAGTAAGHHLGKGHLAGQHAGLHGAHSWHHGPGATTLTASGAGIHGHSAGHGTFTGTHTGKHPGAHHRTGAHPGPGSGSGSGSPTPAPAPPGGSAPAPAPPPNAPAPPPSDPVSSVLDGLGSVVNSVLGLL